MVNKMSNPFGVSGGYILLMLVRQPAEIQTLQMLQSKHHIKKNAGLSSNFPLTLFLLL